MDLAALFERHHGELFRYVARYTGDADLADDVVQDVFVRLAERPPGHREQLRGWLFRVATTIAIDAQRRARRRTVLVNEQASSLPVAEPSPSPARLGEQEEVRTLVRGALATLSEKERAVLLMREEGFTHREIADAVGTTTGSVGTMFARALNKLAARLDLDAEDA